MTRSKDVGPTGQFERAQAEVAGISHEAVPPKLDSIEPEAGELLPCPFCGGEAESDHLRGYLTMMGGRLDHGAAIYCTSCHADMMICRADTREWSDEERMAVLREAWNRRASPAQVAVPADPIDWQRIDNALVSCASLIRTLGRGDDISMVAAAELDYVRAVIPASPVPSTATQAGAVTRAGDETDGGAE